MAHFINDKIPMRTFDRATCYINDYLHINTFNRVTYCINDYYIYEDIQQGDILHQLLVYL